MQADTKVLTETLKKKKNRQCLEKQSQNQVSTISGSHAMTNWKGQRKTLEIYWEGNKVNTTFIKVTGQGIDHSICKEHEEEVKKDSK